jgi:acyl-CoA synthetase (NDP forming)
VPELSDAVREQLRQFLPAAASVSNPIDMIASARAESYRRTIATALPAPDVDAVIIIYIPVDRNDSQAVAQAIKDGVVEARAAGGAGKPVLACLMASDGARVLRAGDETIPSYLFPESAARVLARAANYAEWRSKPLAMVPGFPNVRRGDAKKVVDKAIETRGACWLSAQECHDVLAAFGITQVAGGLARNADEAAEIAGSLGFPVAMKLSSQRVLHKSDIGAVRLNIPDEATVRRVFDEIKQDDMDGILVQRMIRNGVELMIGVAEDPSFGPLIAFGLGGIHVEILADVVFRVTPLTDRDAQEMVRGIRGYRLLDGYRGHPPADVNAIEETLLRVSRMVEDVPEVRELDLNPVFALTPGQGCVVVDTRIRVAPAKA